MKYKIKITDKALSDIEQAVFYIKDELHNLTAANNLLDLSMQQIQNLSNFPFSNPLVDDDFLRQVGFRFLVIKNFLAFYIVTEDTVKIIRFVYKKRNWSDILMNEEIE